MHLYVLTRGVKNLVDEFIDELRGKYLPMKMTWKDKEKMKLLGKTEDVMMQLGVRPVQLWEIVFPKEHKDLVLTTILGKCQKPRKEMRKWLYLLKKCIGCKNIEPYKDDVFMPINKEYVAVYPIGLKEDGILDTNDYTMEAI